MFQRHVIREVVEMKSPHYYGLVPTKKPLVPNDAACLEIEWRPVALGNQRSTADDAVLRLCSSMGLFRGAVQNAPAQKTPSAPRPTPLSAECCCSVDFAATLVDRQRRSYFCCANLGDFPRPRLIFLLYLLCRRRF